MAVARIVSRWKFISGGNQIEAVSFAPSGVAVTDITEYTSKVVAENIADGDPVVCEVEGLSAAQLTALRNRADVIRLTDKQDADYDDTTLTRAQVTAIATRIRDEFGVPLAKIREFVEDKAITRKELEQAIRRLCKARKEGGK